MINPTLKAEPLLSPSLEKIQAVLFDLDGTLADTAPDLAAAVNKMCVARNLPTVAFEILRPLASAGAAGLLARAFGISAEHPAFHAMRAEFLQNYADNICINSTLFPGIDTLLTEMSSHAIRWGIVTNKWTKFAEPLVAQLGLQHRALCLVSGDTTPHSKPHPAPLLHAATQLNIAPAEIVYIGDDLRDVQAGRAAGMLTVAAAYGYCGQPQPPEEWNADYIVYSPAQLHTLLQDLPGMASKG